MTVAAPVVIVIVGGSRSHGGGSWSSWLHLFGILVSALFLFIVLFKVLVILLPAKPFNLAGWCLRMARDGGRRRGTVVVGGGGVCWDGTVNVVVGDGIMVAGTIQVGRCRDAGGSWRRRQKHI
jgi:hypothetical protein